MVFLMFVFLEKFSPKKKDKTCTMLLIFEDYLSDAARDINIETAVLFFCGFFGRP